MAQAAKVLSPTRSPLHLFGAELRRRRLDTGLSQADFGRCLNYSPDLVRRVESGERLPSYEFVVDCDATLGAGEALIRMWPLLEREHRLRSNSSLAYISSLPDRQVIDWLVAPAAPRIVSGEGRGVGDDEAELRRLRTLDHAQGAGTTYADVAGRIGAGLEALARMSPQTAIGFLELAGYGAVDLGADGVAQRHYLQALDIVCASADRTYGGYLIAVSLGHLALHCGDTQQAVRLATAAIHGTAGVAGPAVHAVFLVVLARAHARLGEEAACTKALLEVDALLDRRDAADEPGWVAYFGPADLADERAHCFFDLGHHAQAQAEIAVAMDLLEPHRTRRRAIDMALLASSLARSGEVDQACAAGRAAVDYAAHTLSFRSAHRVALMMAELHAHVDQRDVRELTEYAPATLPQLPDALSLTTRDR